MIWAAAVTMLSVASATAIMFNIYLKSPRTGPFDVDFSLIDDRGLPVNQSIFHGKPSLVFFGYTHCPQTCPTTLFEVADWLNSLGEQGETLNAYFLSIDPERDTQQIMHSYVNAFSSRIVGVTGSPEEMKRVADGWFIRASKKPNADGTYSMSHTVNLMLVGSDGRLKGLIPYGTDRDEALKKIKDLLLQSHVAA